jgi:cysteine peptidase B
MSLAKQMSPLGSKVAVCPAESTNTTFCDCSFENPSTDADLFVVINAKNEDGAFNSFHCYVGGANICAWGVNNGEQGSMGQCSFLLPAGASYSCQMEWGATAFPSVTALPLATSIFPASSSSVANPSMRGVAYVPASRPETELRHLFSEFQAVHGPVAPERFEQFSQFVALADVHPTNQPLRHGGDLSSLATLSREEFEHSYRNCATLEDMPVTSRPWTVDVNAHNTPNEVDWRKHGAVTPVKDQGQCGSCWSFSTTGVLEGAWSVAGQGLTQLSEQELVSCDNEDGNAGCGGGWPWKAVDYVHKNGIDTEASYPYSSGSGTAPSCTKSSGTPASIQVLDHSVVESDEEVMAAWVAKNGPLSVSVDAMTNLWWPYSGGIMSGCCNTQVDHAVLIVGFGEENGQKYWLIKNSWNAQWGEEGYIRLERGTNQCGITYQPVGAVVSGGPAPPPTPPTPTPPTPPPPTPPSPTPSTTCPSDATLVSTAQGRECLWTNGTKGVLMPLEPSEYCDYIADGYFGYFWSKSQGAYNCPSSARIGSNDQSYFCTWTDGEGDVHIPQGAIPDCGKIAQGRIGFVMPGAEALVI